MRPQPPRNAAAPALAPPSRAEWGAVALVLVAAAALRVRLAADTPLWFDEIYTLWVARLAPADLLRTVAGDIHPPLHYLLVWAWRAVGGEGDLWIKSLSILCGLGSILVGWATARAIAGRFAGLATAALLAVHRTHVAFSQESRAFMLLWLLLAASAFTAWRWTRAPGRRDALWHVVTGAAALYTHYLAIPVLALQALWGLVTLRRDWKRALLWLALQLAIVALFAPQLPILEAQRARLGADHWVRPPTFADAMNLLRQLGFGAWYLALPLFALAAVPFSRESTRKPALLLAVTTFPIVIACFVASLGRGGLFVERYMYFVLPALVTLAGAGLASLPIPDSWPRAARLALPIAVLAGFLGLGGRALLLKPVHEEARNLEAAATWLDTQAIPEHLVLHAESHSLFYFRHYQGAHGRHVLLMTRERIPYYDGDLLTPEDWRWPTDRPPGDDRWWAVVNGTSGIPTEPARRWIEANGGVLVASYGKVEVWTRPGVPRGR